MINVFTEIFERDLKKLAEEMNSYAGETDIWKTAEGINNSGGNLCLHICGGLRHFIGATLGVDGYVRNRDAEFALKNIPREKLLAEIEVTRQVMQKVLIGMDPEMLEKEYPLNVLGKMHTTQFFLTHLIAHLNYHLGQINYHRRLVK